MQDDPFYVDFFVLQERSRQQPGQLPVPGRDVQRDQRRPVGHAEHGRDHTAFGSITENQANDPRSVQLQVRITY